MTIAGWIIWIIIAITVVVMSFVISEGNKFVTSIGVIISLLLLGGMIFYFNFTAAGKRAFKTQKSNLDNGIDRTVEVYDATGNLIKSYEGKFDISYDENRIIFDDENDKRHVIYYPTGTIVIDEK